MLATMLILILLAAALGAALFRMRPPLTTLVAHSSAPEDDPLPLVERINRLLPQTQCQQCQYDGCKPYAEAIVAGNADINQCPPGGERGIAQLAQLLGRAPIPLNPQHGMAKRLHTVAVIDEAICIGCTKCILACPVDAILGAAQQMHTVIESECTGCELCIAPCPVDCIEMVPATTQPLALIAAEVTSAADTLTESKACIRCGACAEACPPRLLPQLLHQHVQRQQYEQAAEQDLFDCIECGQCDTVCPSELPLLQSFRDAKHELRVQRDLQQRADAARARYDARAQRLARQRDEKAQLRAQKKNRVATAEAPPTITVAALAPEAEISVTPTIDDPVARALAAAKAKKLAKAAAPDGKSQP
jgi:electron transport complex protein RnfB